MRRKFRRRSPSRGYTSYRHGRRTEILIPRKNQDMYRRASAAGRLLGMTSRSRATLPPPARQRFVFIAERRKLRAEPAAEIYDAGEFTASGSRHVKRARERSQWRFH